MTHTDSVMRETGTSASAYEFTPRADAFVFFGATGDLAYKQIFPALQALVRRGLLDMPIIGVARSGWSLDQLRFWTP